MPTVTKLVPDTVTFVRGVSERQRIAALYDALLADFAAGDWGDVLLEAGDERAVVSRRLKAAAARRDLAVHFRQRRDDRLRFQVVAAPAKVARPDVPVAHAEMPDPLEDTQPVPVAPPLASQSPRSRERREPARRQTTQRYQDVLPRWMRDGEQAPPHRPLRPKRRDR
jgi:hypothetical protein